MPTGTPRASSLVRQQVRGLLERSPAFLALAPAARRAIARDMGHVAAALVDPHGLLSQEFRDPLLAGVMAHPGSAPAQPAGIRMGSAAMDGLVAAVDFPSFVAGLIDGVFGAIVNGSIQQMQAYAELVATVSKTVDEFVHDTLSEPSARVSLASEFPEVFCWVGTRSRRLHPHAAAGSSALAALADAIGLREPVNEPARPGEVKRIVAAARQRMARNRQQLLATMVLMGINRIVVTDGRITAQTRRRAGGAQ